MATKQTPIPTTLQGNGAWHAARRPSPSAMGGALFGGVMGAALGPVGALAGMVIGGLTGKLVDRRYDAASARSPSPGPS